jgi:hypothetical protein
MDDDPKIFQTMELPFSTPSAKGHEVFLSTKYTQITPENRQEYVKLALNYRLHEFDEQIKSVRDGMSKVIPVPLLSLFSASELQEMVCGSPDIPLGLLKTVATYKGIDSTSSLVQWYVIFIFFIHVHYKMISFVKVLGSDGRIYKSRAITFPTVCVGTNKVAENNRRF